jgi:glycosyltransferase involved in cell wall biosynthesis
MKYNIIILTYNEELNINDCIINCNLYTDAVYVVDSGSTDYTITKVSQNVNIAFRVNVQKGPFKISEQRNWSLMNLDLKYEWTLFIDADERVTSFLNSEIIDNISNTRLDKFYIRPINIFLGKPLKWTFGKTNWHARLVKGNALHFRGGVMEDFAIDNAGYLIEKYEHHFFSSGFSRWIDKHLRYASEEIRLINDADFNTTRKGLYRMYFSKFIFLRPFARLFKTLLFNFGFFDGRKGILYSLMLFWYELLIVIMYYLSKFSKNK